ncbi:MAG: PqiB family protein, partial [Nevskia sp.]|uniref:PqiB family protein n=1 Tax=Nevskia sp. TaxID=1929292 RepID=UPI0040373C38
MSETPSMSALPAPEPRRDGRKRLSLIWLVPLVAALVGLALVIRTWLQTGPTITIRFDTAESLQNGATEVRYKDVVVGKVSSIQLREDDSGVTVEVELTPDAKRIAVKDSRFWVVRPRIGIGGVSGINTLLSGAYIGVDVGRSGEQQRDFIGLEKPPPVTHDQKGKQFTLTTLDAGSITIGAPVYYRRVAVGRVVDATLDEDGKRITVRVFIDAPYDRFVTGGVRFWNAGGIDLAVSSEGLRLNTQSLATVVAGGIAFQPLDERKPGEPAREDSRFELYDGIATALAPPDGPSVRALLVLRQSTRGLTAGTPVDFNGLVIGAIRSIEPQYDVRQQSFYSKVMVELYLERLGPAWSALKGVAADSDRPALAVLNKLIDQGLTAQLRAGNLLTG